MDLLKHFLCETERQHSGSTWKIDVSNDERDEKLSKLFIKNVTRDILEEEDYESVHPVSPFSVEIVIFLCSSLE